MITIDIAQQNTLALPIPSAIAIDLAPELAVLSLLDATCLILTRVLACAHPEIGSSDYQCHSPGCPPNFPSASACTASTIITHLEALRFGISSYRRSRARELPGIAALPDQQDLL